MKDQRLILSQLITKLTKFKIDKDYCTHREHTNRAFGIASVDNVAEMSSIKKLFRPYVELEDTGHKQKSPKYRWKTEQFIKEHPDLFGEDTNAKFSTVEQMVVALKDEYYAAKDDVQRNSHRIDRIESVRLGNNNQAYACFLNLNDDEEPNLKDGSPCDIRLRGAIRGQAQVIDYDAKEQCVYLSSNSDLSLVKGAGIRLVVDLTWLLQALIDKLKSGNDTTFNSGPLAGFISGRIQQKDLRYPVALWPGKLNISQITAYKSALYKGVSLIWGPPGTGKSFTLAHIILSLARVGGKTVVACISNAALDSLILGFLKVYDEFKKESPYATVESNFVRLGVSRTQKVLDSKMFYPKDFQMDAWKARLVEIRQSLIKKNVEREDRVKLKKEQNELYKRIKEHNQSRIDKAKVIFTTAAQFTVLTVDREERDDDPTDQIGVSLKKIDFDNIILDEVSMMYPPQFVGLCQNIGKRIIAAGDFRQLGPIHLSATALSLRWLAKDVFKFAKIFDRNRNVLSKPYLIQLLDQWRSHPSICKLINRPFYNGKLIAKAKGGDHDILALPPYANHPVVYINLEDDERNKVKRSSKGSRSNRFSASVTAYLAGWAASESDTISVGVITPYRAQVGLITKNLHIGYPEAKQRIKVGSIHSFQGDEADVIIYDIVDAPNEKLGLLYQHETGERLINVALSRAKRKLIVVGDIDNMLNGKGNTLLSDKFNNVIIDIRRFNLHKEQKLIDFIDTLR